MRDKLLLFAVFFAACAGVLVTLGIAGGFPESATAEPPPPVPTPEAELRARGEAHAAAFSTTRVTDQLPKMVMALEQHSRCGEGIMSLDNDMLVYFAPAGAAFEQAMQEVKAFFVPAHVMLTIRPGVWHCMPFPAKEAVVNVLNVLPERTYANDCTMHLLEEKDRIAIVM